MKVIFSQANGQRSEGALLAAGKYSLRVMLPGSPDITELHNEYGQWMLETGEAVELDSFISDSILDLSLFSREVFGMSRAAGAFPERS